MIVRAQYTYITASLATVNFFFLFVLIQTCARMEQSMHDVSEQLDMLLNQSFYD